MKLIVCLQLFYYFQSFVGSTYVSYSPGDLTVEENGLVLSRGLRSRIIAESGERLHLVHGESDENFLSLPDGAACFPYGSGWVWVINSEEDDGNGGVGAIYFDSEGEMTDYATLLKRTSRNCSGGKTPWYTWISCEEVSGGHCYEVDPYGINQPNRTVLGGDSGGRFESAAYDDYWNFYVTEDADDGALRRYSPSYDAIMEVRRANNYWSLLTSGHGNIDYLVLEPYNETHGLFGWSSSKSNGEKSAERYYPNSEGIEYHDGKLYFTAKENKRLFTLDLAAGTYEAVSIRNNLFDGEPDQIKYIKHVIGLPDDRQEIMYFTEDYSSSGIHARNLRNGKFFTILHSLTWSKETTSMAFSPDNRHFYFCFQKEPGTCFDITREDGLSFDDETLDIVYH